jgi:NADP-dependent 3-hydroxy acid dehydrogenase YdfG
MHAEHGDGVSDSLRGRTVLIIGASSGIGLATAEVMAAAGARVGMVARRKEVLERAAERVGGLSYAADVTAVGDVEGLSKWWVEMYAAAPDILINAAGAFTIDPFTETTPEDFDRNLAANLKAPFLVLRAFLPGMKSRGSGHVVNVGSIAGQTAFPGNGAYSASKFGLRGMHEVLAVELSGSGVRLSLIDPAATDTPLWDPLAAREGQGLPTRVSMLRAEDVARAILFVTNQPEGVEVSHLAIRSVR